ncbi:MAG: hypothetical protein C5S52_08765 [ANME-2 cluster archaeon]|nr:hypothetical protein [ANME-2 cluster archaeon]
MCVIHSLKQFNQIILLKSGLLENVEKCAFCKFLMQWDNGFIGSSRGDLLK